jgi:uncharacterized protein (TIGR04255 family)
LSPTYPHLSRAPLTEALIDFRVKRISEFPHHQVETLKSRLRDRYPVAVNLTNLNVTLQPGRAELVQGTSVPAGILLKSEDEKSVVQFRADGFTFNRLDPYTSWDEIYPETMRLWHEYVRITQPQTVSRLATRYINRLRLPLPIADLDEYLTAGPRLPPRLPHELRGYLIRVVVYDREREVSAIVTQTPEADPLDPAHLQILLDIDAYKDELLYLPDSSEIPAVLSRLRHCKNAIFYGSITKRTQEMYE